jgi:hypothetical protein
MLFDNSANESTTTPVPGQRERWCSAHCLDRQRVSIDRVRTIEFH